MAKTGTNLTEPPIDPWRAHAVRMLQRVSGLPATVWVRRRLVDWRLLPFMFRRTAIGRRINQRGGMLKFLAHRFAYAQGERLVSARLGSTATRQIVSFAFV